MHDVSGLKPYPLRNLKEQGQIFVCELPEPIFTASEVTSLHCTEKVHSTADDLSIFAMMLLNEGIYNGKRILKSETIERMTVPQSPPNKKLRGFGWDIKAPLASNRSDLFPTTALIRTVCAMA